MNKEAPIAVREQIKVLYEYELNDKLNEFDILHMYPTILAHPDGFHDSMFFDLHLYNTETMSKRIIENRDGLRFYNVMDLNIIRIFADGSTLVRFKSMKSIDIFQECEIY